MKPPVAAIVALLTCLASQTALASPPPGFRRTQVYLQPSFQMSRFVGPLAGDTGWSVGFGATQGIQFGYFGANITLNTDYFLTTEASKPPPYQHGLQIARFHLAGRFMVPFGEFWPFLEISATRLSLISNSLVEQMGPELNHHAFGGALGIRLVQLSPLFIEIQSNWEYLVGMEESSLVTVQLALGVRTLL
ncbi:MAG: hypothetical protein JW797_00740 [Bradymonadales bacterium]|nr:hypothetical protein [Bradymonadales bacterium]